MADHDTHDHTGVPGVGASGPVTTSGLTQATDRLLGRTTASTGAVEEITVGSGLSLSSGSLTASAATLSMSDTGIVAGPTSLPNDYTNYTDLTSLSLAAGTWVVIASVDSDRSTGGIALAVRTWDGTNAGGWDEHGTYGVPGLDLCHHVVGSHVLSTTTTVKLQAKANASGCAMSSAHLVAIRVA